LLAVSNGLASSKLQNTYSINMPVIIVFFYYFLIFLVFMLAMRCFKAPKLSYILIAAFDSQGNFLNIYAFQYLKFSYPFIISISSVLWTFLLTYLFVRTYKYKLSHFIGTAISSAGIAVSLYGYMVNNQIIEDGDSDDTKGIILCCVSALLYALSSITQEITFKTPNDIYDFFPWFGFVGMVISGVEAVVFDNYQSFIDNASNFNSEVILLMVEASVSLFIFVTLVPFYIKRLSASMFNISQVSQIFWSYIIAKIFFSQENKEDYWFYIGFVLILFGIIVFNLYSFKEKQSQDGQTQTEAENTVKKKTSGTLGVNDDSRESGGRSQSFSDYYKNRTALYTKSTNIMNAQN